MMPPIPLRPRRLSFHQREVIDSRVLGAVRFVNGVTGQPIPGRFHVVPLPMGGPGGASAATPPVRILPNRQGLHVIHAAPGFGDYCEQFLPAPESPEPFSQRLGLRVIDPSYRYFPSDFSIPLPRLEDTTRVLNEFLSNSVFRPVDERLLPSPTAAVAHSSSEVRVLVWRESTDPDDPDQPIRNPVPGALVRIFPKGRPVPRARSFTEWRRLRHEPPRSAAEALLPVTGIPTTLWNDDEDGAVLTDAIEVDLDVRFEQSFTTRCLADFDPRWRNDEAPFPDGPPPSLSRLESTADPLPEGIVGGRVAEALTLRAGTKVSVHAIFDPDGELRLVR